MFILAILNIIFFKTKQTRAYFFGRGLIFVLQKSNPSANHKIKIINYKPYTEKQGTDFEAYINSKNKNTKEIRQNELKENIANWNFIKQSIKLL